MNFEKEPDGQLFGGGYRGLPYYVYDISGWGVSAGATLVVFLDDEGLDWVYFHDHPANNRPEEWKTEAPKRESERDRYERVKRAHGYE